MDTTLITDKKSVELFIKRCFERFGSMNKNDYEVELMYLLLNNCNEDSSDHALSTQLKIPISKVKRLRYEADLQHPKDSNYYKSEFYKIINTTSFKTDNNGNLMFSVKNKALREYLNDCIEKAGSFFDSSFVGDIIKLTPTDFFLLIAGFENKEELVKRIKESISQNKRDLPKDLAEKGVELLKATLKDVTNNFAPNVTNFIIESIENNLKVNNKL